MAPAEVPQITLNGDFWFRGNWDAIAFKTPTWYAALAPPPVNNNAFVDLGFGDENIISFLIFSVCDGSPNNLVK